VLPTGRTVIYLRRLLPTASSGLVGVTSNRSGQKTNPCSFSLASNRGLPSQHLSMLLVRSYRTFAPLPVAHASMEPIGGMFLWHYPHAHAHWWLASKFGLSEARTFLGLSTQDATVSPTLSITSLRGFGLAVADC